MFRRILRNNLFQLSRFQDSPKHLSCIHSQGSTDGDFWAMIFWAHFLVFVIARYHIFFFCGLVTSVMLLGLKNKYFLLIDKTLCSYLEILSWVWQLVLTSKYLSEKLFTCAITVVLWVALFLRFIFKQRSHSFFGGFFFFFFCNLFMN